MKVVACCALLMLTSCHDYQIMDDYFYAPEEDCSCVVKPKLTTGRMHIVKTRKVARCHSSDLQLIVDSVNTLRAQLYSAEEISFTHEDSLNNKIPQIEADLDSLEAKNLKYKVKIKEKRYYQPNDNLYKIAIRRKTVFYKNGILGYRRFKTERKKKETHVISF